MRCFCAVLLTGLAACSGGAEPTKSLYAPDPPAVGAQARRAHETRAVEVRGPDGMFRVSAPAGSVRLETGVGAAAEPARLTIRGADGVLLERDFPAGDEWHDVALDLPASDAAVALEISLEPAGAALGRLRVLAEGPLRPNVLLLTYDTLRADHLSCYGYARPTSPHIDSLAEDGLRCARVLAQTNWTYPSYVSTLTGLYPESHGVVRGDRKTPDALVMLAERLSQAGWATEAHVSGTFTEAATGIAQGFDRYDDSGSSVGEAKAAHMTVTSGRIADAGIDALERLAGQRFFLMLHFFDPHQEYVPPPPYDTMFDPDYRGTMTGVVSLRQEPRWNPQVPRRDLEHVKALYDGEIAFADHHTGRVLARLDELGLADTTLVIVHGDHGDGFFEHQKEGHSNTLFGEETSTPLIFRLPRLLPAGTVIEQPVANVDVAPTILDILGVPSEEGAFQGISLLPAATGGRLPRDRPLLSSAWLPTEHFPGQSAFILGDMSRSEVALIQGNWKLYRTWRDKWRLFNLSEDPGERTDLAKRLPQRVEILRRRLDGLDQRLRARTTDPGAARALTEEERERIEGLGYADTIEPR